MTGWLTGAYFIVKQKILYILPLGGAKDGSDMKRLQQLEDGLIALGLFVAFAFIYLAS